MVLIKIIKEKESLENAPEILEDAFKKSDLAYEDPDKFEKWKTWFLKQKDYFSKEKHRSHITTAKLKGFMLILFLKYL